MTWIFNLTQAGRVEEPADLVGLGPCDDRIRQQFSRGVAEGILRPVPSYTEEGISTKNPKLWRTQPHAFRCPKTGGRNYLQICKTTETTCKFARQRNVSPEEPSPPSSRPTQQSCRPSSRADQGGNLIMFDAPHDHTCRAADPSTSAKSNPTERPRISKNAGTFSF